MRGALSTYAHPRRECIPTHMPRPEGEGYKSVLVIFVRLRRRQLTLLAEHAERLDRGERPDQCADHHHQQNPLGLVHGAATALPAAPAPASATWCRPRGSALPPACGR